MCFFKKKSKPKPKSEYKGIPVGILRGPRFGTVLSYYCTNCYYGVSCYGLHEDDERCPKCNALLNWDDKIDEVNND